MQNGNSFIFTLKLIGVETVVDWTNKVMVKMRRKKNLIIKSFKICGLSVNLDGSEDHFIHNYEYLLRRSESQLHIYLSV